MKSRLLVPRVKPLPEARPAACAYCQSPLLQRHQQVLKALVDTHVRQTQAVRYRCTACGRTFRHYAQGASPYRQSQRVISLAVLLWTLGLSQRAVALVLVGLEAAIHRSTMLRDIHRAGASLWDFSPVGPVRVLGVDETVVRMRGRAVFLGFVVDTKTGTTVGVDILVERDSEAFLGWLCPYVERLGVQVLVTDDLNTYKPAVEGLGIRHQVCLAHVRKGVTKRLRKVEGWEEEKAFIQHLVRKLPQNGGALLLRLERRVLRSPSLRRLVVDLQQRWPALVCHQRVAGVPATNNRTEQAIGKSEVRFKTVRGFKSPLGVMAGVASLSGSTTGQGNMTWRSWRLRRGRGRGQPSPTTRSKGHPPTGIR
jgi:transposase-like protein